MQGVFGLDIGDKSIKAVEGKMTGGVFSITSVSEILLPPGAIRNWEVRDEDVLAETIKNLLVQAQPRAIRSRLAVVSVPEPKVFLHSMSVPNTPEDKLAEVVKWELAANISEDIQDMYWDWEAVRGDSGPEQILAAAASRELLGKYEEVLARLGIRVIAFDMESKALVRAMGKQLSTKGATLIADISARRTSLSVYSRGLVSFTSGLMIGGDNCTEEIAKEQGISEAQAEEMKMEMDLTKPVESGAQTIVCPMVNGVATEINRTIDFYNGKNREQAPVDKIILAGGASLMKGLPEYLKNKLSIGAELADFDKSLDKKSQALVQGRSLVFGTALGLAIRAASPHPIVDELNLVSQEIQEQATSLGVRRLVAWITAIAITVAILFLGAYGGLLGYLYWDTNNLENKMTGGALEKTGEQLDLESEIGKVNTYLDTIDKIRNTQNQWSQVIGSINQAAPAGLNISRLSLTNEEPSRIIGTAASRSQVVDFQNKLSTIDRINNVENPLSNFSTGEKDVIDFEITFDLER
ncbi:type IV pilus assembly protein PilM [Patescibacteria group bacterium]